MYDAVTFGEIIADGYPITSSHIEKEHAPGYEFRIGGAPVNTAAGLAKLGENTAVICCVGNDEPGEKFTQSLRNIGVDISFVQKHPSEKTTQALVQLSPLGDRNFSFILGAHAHFPNPNIVLPKTRLFHFGSILQIDQASNDLTHSLISQAKSHGAIISYDPNIRETLWSDMNQAKETILDTIPLADIVKISEEEALFLSGEVTIEDATHTLLAPKNAVCIVTLANRGCFVRTHDGIGREKTIPIQAIDTTGAGDAFNAGFLKCIINDPMPIQSMDLGTLASYLRFGMVAGSLTTTKMGAINALPTLSDIMQYEYFIDSGEEI